MKAVGGMLILVLSGMGLSLFLGAPFFMCWNILPFSQPEITWVQGSGMLFILWSTTFIVLFAKTIMGMIAEGASLAINPNADNPTTEEE